jgi:predicted lipase
LLTKNPSASILTTGHSLGAAIAAIAAIELKSIFPSTKVVIHNYGQPRLGNVELAKHMS